MSPNQSIDNKALSEQHVDQTSKMSSALTSSPRLDVYHRTETSTSSSVHSSGILGMLADEDHPPQYNYESERLKSFEDWPVTFLSPSAMAAAGFYYLKREDVVRCAFCGVEVGCWVEGDDPMNDHEKWSPSCGFIKKLSVGNVPFCINSNSKSAPIVPSDNGFDTCGRIELRPEHGIPLSCKEKCLPPLEKLGIHKSRAPSFPHLNTVESRLRTYETWPVALKLKPITLSEAGFFYTGKGDQTICFHCGGGLKDWEETDEPWVEHARWFSKCNYVILMKGTDFIDDVCVRKTTKVKSKSEENINRRSPSSCIVEQKAQEDSNTEDLSKPEHRSMCKICYTEEVGVVFLPCGHLVACVKCALSLTTCAVCRQAVTATVRAILS